MIEDHYSVKKYFLVVFDINLDVTLCSLLAAGFSAVPAVFLVTYEFCVHVREVGESIIGLACFERQTYREKMPTVQTRI